MKNKKFWFNLIQKILAIAVGISFAVLGIRWNNVVMADFGYVSLGYGLGIPIKETNE